MCLEPFHKYVGDGQLVPIIIVFLAFVIAKGSTCKRFFFFPDGGKPSHLQTMLYKWKSYSRGWISCNKGLKFPFPSHTVLRMSVRKDSEHITTVIPGLEQNIHWLPSSVGDRLPHASFTSCSVPSQWSSLVFWLSLFSLDWLTTASASMKCNCICAVMFSVFHSSTGCTHPTNVFCSLKEASSLGASKNKLLLWWLWF